jgi:hypothetical protein
MTDQMSTLLSIRAKECPERPITDASTDEAVNCWLVMEGIELAYINYQGTMQPMFMCGRYSEKFGDSVYFFKTYAECKRVWLMDEAELDEYITSLQNNS